MQNRSNSGSPRDPLWLRSRNQMHSKKGKRNKKSVYSYLALSLSPPKRGEGSERRRRRGGKTASILPPLSPSLRRRFLVRDPRTAVLSGPTLGHFPGRKLKSNPRGRHHLFKNMSAVREREGGGEEPAVRTGGPSESQGRPELRAFVCSFQTDSAGTPTLASNGRGAPESRKSVRVFKEDPSEKLRRCFNPSRAGGGEICTRMFDSHRGAEAGRACSESPAPPSRPRRWFVPPQLERCEQFPLETNFLQFSSLWALTL